MRSEIEGALATVPFSPPIGPAYCEAVLSHLRAKLPVTLQLEAYVKGKPGELELIVEARAGDAAERIVTRVG